MKFYRIDDSHMFYNRKYAYLSVNSTNKIPNEYQGPTEEYLTFRCPYCGYERYNIFYPEKFIAVFNKDSVGDISVGVVNFQLAVSEKFLKMIEKYQFKGIEEIREYKYMETTRHKTIESVKGSYFETRVHFEPLRWRYVDKENECLIVVHNRTCGCSKCLGNRDFLKIPKDAKLYLDGLNEVEYDIFSTIDNPGHIFVSERFVEACKTEKITNILNRLVEVFGYSDLSQAS